MARPGSVGSAGPGHVRPVAGRVQRDGFARRPTSLGWRMPITQTSCYRPMAGNRTIKTRCTRRHGATQAQALKDSRVDRDGNPARHHFRQLHLKTDSSHPQEEPFCERRGPGHPQTSLLGRSGVEGNQAHSFTLHRQKVSSTQPARPAPSEARTHALAGALTGRRHRGCEPHEQERVKRPRQ